MSLRAYKGEPGWTADTTYLYAGLLDKDPRTAPEYSDLLEKPDELNDLAWIERRMKEEGARAEATNKSGDFLFDIREMLLAMEEAVVKRDAKLIAKGKLPISQCNPEEVIDITIMTEKYESAKGKKLFDLLHGWLINVYKEYGVINGQTSGKSSNTTFRIQAGLFQGDNFTYLMKIHYDYLFQVVSNVETAESNLKRLRAQYEKLKTEECSSSAS